MTRSNFFKYLTICSGLILVYIGLKFLIQPEAGEIGFGLHFQENGDYSFHYIKGIRDLFTGMVIVLLAAMNERKALVVVLLMGVMVPFTDMTLVLQATHGNVMTAMPHIIAIILIAITAAGTWFSGRKAILPA
ncbi:DUF4267 domain-containing protein [Chitinophaga polysaccharea]|uniref:DUF4267 domain-containing protein n=1 Tax=Chitinophaga TaxID=79328 RepID=UPI0014552DB4|nr:MULTISPECIES: DUF4267 domain-containing protein [Chitinophaga]NLR61119.1 DUF4267 domain-containing protein [Chitinophaga polysaccharea]NLU94957.1 DUF4267 domain-containing protein [Chitinophaga sp. Ak27]